MGYLEKRDYVIIGAICAAIFAACAFHDPAVWQTIRDAASYAVIAAVIVWGVVVAYVVLRFVAEWIADQYGRVRSGQRPWGELAALSVILLFAYGVARLAIYG